jgi:hypothetical protein
LASAAMAAWMALPDADMLTANRLPHSDDNVERAAGRSELVIRLLPEVLPHSQLHRFLKTNSTNRGKEAPVFRSPDPLFFEPSSPKTQACDR